MYRNIFLLKSQFNTLKSRILRYKVKQSEMMKEN